MKQRRILKIMLVLFVLCCTAGPVMAGERFISGGPDLTAAILGTNDFSPGKEVTIPVTIQNSGLIDYTFTYPNQLTSSDLPNTAKLMKVSLGAGDAPVTIKSDPQLLGDLPGGDNAVAGFKVQIAPDAPYETYTLPLTITYTYLMRADQYGTDAIQNFYKEATVNLDLPVRIKPEVVPVVLSADPGNLNAGTQGFLNITIRNAGNEDGKESTVKLSQNGNSPVIPVASSVYVGDFPAGSNVSIQYKVSVDKNAEAITYPANISVTYKNRDGDLVTSDQVVFGVPVNGKIGFDVVSPPVTIGPGQRKVIQVTYMNTGTATVYGAQARLFTVDPFTSSDDTSYLGDMAPGTTKTANFDVTNDPSATVKEYGLDSEVMYRDALSNDQVSDRVKVPIDVVPTNILAQIAGNPYAIILIVVVIGVVAAVGFTRYRKKMAKGKPK